MTKSTPVFGLVKRYRAYKCTACGHEQEVQTDHTNKALAVCQHCSWMASKYDGVTLFGTAHRWFSYMGQPLCTADRFNPSTKETEL